MLGEEQKSQYLEEIKSMQVASESKIEDFLRREEDKRVAEEKAKAEKELRRQAKREAKEKEALEQSIILSESQMDKN